MTTAGSIGLPVSTLAMVLFFGSIILTFVVGQVVERRWNGSKSQSADQPLSEGQVWYRQLGRCAAELAGLLLITWICENKPLFDHQAKIHDMDFFAFIVLTSVLVALLFSVHVASKDQGILNRDQTEEWRGFMQMVFLLYHYFALEEVYPLIRLFISCYVFLTGFGNTSFFYLKRDYSVVRLVSMLWRLCFSCLLLAMTHDNPIILYYIVPLHTFYFLVAYVTMSLFEGRVNYTRFGLHIKICILGIMLFVVWEFPVIFETVFFFLSNEPHPGAPVGAFGTRYEWQFRSGLDHYSSFFGMIFACGFPLLELRDVQVVAKSPVIRYTCAVIFAFLFFVWAYWLFPLPKLDYNSKHAYTFVLPMCAYLFLRNLTPSLRRVHLEMFAFAGKYTLETYLLQHHVWLTSNAKTVLVVLPGFPKANFVLVSIGYFLLSMKLYDLTVRTKTLLIPSNDGIAGLQNLLTTAGVLGFCYTLSNFLVFVQLSQTFVIILVVFGLSIAWGFIGCTLLTSNGRGATVMKRALMTLAAAFVLSGLLSAAYPADSIVEETAQCDPNNGYWVKDFNGLCGQTPQNTYAYCDSRGWAWPVREQKRCGWKRITKLDPFDKLYFVGDSQDSVNYALALMKLEDPMYKYSAKNPQITFGKKIEIVKSKEDLAKHELKENTIVVCPQDQSDVCDKLTTGIAIYMKEKDQPVSNEEGTAVPRTIDAVMIKSSAVKSDQLVKDVTYREVVYDAIVQVLLNHAAKAVKKPAVKAGPPPPGGLAHNPIYGTIFLGVAFLALFTSDGYLGMVGVMSRLLGRESEVTWAKAMEKVHSLVPGLHPEAPAAAVPPHANGGNGSSMVQMTDTTTTNTALDDGSKDPELAVDTDRLIPKV